MNHWMGKSVVALLLVGLVAGCTHLDAVAKPPNVSQQQRVLNEGYSLMYQDAGNLDLGELILYVKVESEAMHKLVTAVAEVGGQVKKDLERISKAHAGMRIDLDPLPEMEKRKRAAISKDRAKYFAPLVGHSGREYERTVLIGYSNGLNHERHLCQVMADAEPDADLKKFLRDAQKRYDDLFDRVTALLEKDYFRDPNGKTKD